LELKKLNVIEIVSTDIDSTSSSSGRTYTGYFNQPVVDISQLVVDLSRVPTKLYTSKCTWNWLHERHFKCNHVLKYCLLDSLLYLLSG